MNRFCKFLAAAGLAGHILILGSGQAAFANQAAAAVSSNGTTVLNETTMYVNGAPVVTSFYLDQNYQMVPAVFFRQFGVHVGWDADYRSAVISNDSMIIGLPADQHYADYSFVGTDKWQRDYFVPAVALIEDRAYVPLAYTAKRLGWKVAYDADTKTTYIDTSITLLSNDYIIDGVTDDDLYWLYQIVEAEAGGEGYEGKLAVAASILNRVQSTDWPDTITSVIFQITYDANGKAYYQYSPVLDERIYSVEPNDETVKAVHAALNGEDPTKGATVFYNPDKTDNQWVRSRETYITIGNHVFAE